MDKYKANQEIAREKNHECYVLGCKAYDANEFHKAITLFKESLEYWPEDPQAWMALGNCYSEIKRYKKAEKSYRQALAYSGNQEKENILFNLGNSLFDQGQYSEAIGCYELIKPGTELWRKAKRNVELSNNRNL